MQEISPNNLDSVFTNDFRIRTYRQMALCGTAISSRKPRSSSRMATFLRSPSLNVHPNPRILFLRRLICCIAAFRVRIRNKFETNIYPRQADPPSPSSSTRLHPSISYQRIGTHLISNQFLGDGSFGKVRLAIDTAGHRQLACKTISISPHAGHNATRAVVQKEIDILKGLDHVGQ